MQELIYNLFKVMFLITMPWLTDSAGMLGYDMTSPEFLFFREVIKCARKKRRETNTWRGDFLDLMADTNSMFVAIHSHLLEDYRKGTTVIYC